MEKHTMTLNHSPHMYDKPYYGFDTTFLNFDDVSGNKLFCTFSELDEVDSLIEDIKYKYTVLYNKIFVLQVKSNNEYVCTYNIDYDNLNDIPENTILVHRKKETNTLYTINALNELIKKLNGGVVDVSYRINWQHYRNCILLTQHNELKQLNTKIYKIVEL
jgi:hypothetical protein